MYALYVICLLNSLFMELTIVTRILNLTHIHLYVLDTASM